MRPVVATLAVLAAFPATVSALIGPAMPPFYQAVQAHTTVIGTVTAVEPRPVRVTSRVGPGPAETVEYTVVVVKVESGWGGAAGRTHVRVGFVPPPDGKGKATVDSKGWLVGHPVLKPGQSRCLFLRPAPDDGLFLLDVMTPPLNPAAKKDRPALDRVRRAMAVLADPVKHLSAGTPADRYFAACVLLRDYHGFRGPQEHDQVPLSAEESRLLVAAVRDSLGRKPEPGLLPAICMVRELCVSRDPAWREPKDGENYEAELRAAFENWADGPAANFRVYKNVPRTGPR